MHHQHKHTHKRANSHTDQQPGLSCKASHAHTHTHFKKHTLNFLLTHFPNNTPPLSISPSRCLSLPSSRRKAKQSRTLLLCVTSSDHTHTHTHTLLIRLFMRPKACREKSSSKLCCTESLCNCAALFQSSKM